MTEPEASRLLEQEIASDYAPAIRKLFVKGGKLEGLFTQELFDALISFAWNLGSGFTTAPSGFETIQRNIKNRDINAIADCLVLYRSPGTIFEEGEAGILLDNTAIDILVKETLTMIAELSIKQAKGYMYVDEIEVDYNDSNKMMRIKRSPEQANPEPNSNYAVYFYAK